MGKIEQHPFELNIEQWESLEFRLSLVLSAFERVTLIEDITPKDRGL